MHVRLGPITHKLTLDLCIFYALSSTIVLYLGRKEILNTKIMISTGLPYLQFSMNSQGFSPAILTWPAYDDGRKRENSSA